MAYSKRERMISTDEKAGNSKLKKHYAPNTCWSQKASE